MPARLRRGGECRPEIGTIPDVAFGGEATDEREIAGAFEMPVEMIFGDSGSSMTHPLQSESKGEFYRFRSDLFSNLPPF
jgi:hypothetical protein